ncbi:MAG: sporulation protein YunB [Clostridiales bacterium]|nr:sporulation protein YunB [Candidatus Apopatousia equi]
MIKSCDCNSKKKKLKKLLIWLVIITLIITAIVCYFNYYVNPIILTSNEAVIKSKTISILNSAVQSAFNEDTTYNDLVNITYDTQNNIQSITANTQKVNLLNSNISLNCQDKLNDIENLNFNVPLGTFTGLPILNGIGPKITLNMMPIGSVESKYKSVFTSVGINQTHHEIYIILSANISVLLPGNNSTVKVMTEVLIAESIIVGEVPEVYFGANNLLNTQLNLIP